jgi:hypothetical protein
MENKPGSEEGLPPKGREAGSGDENRIDAANRREIKPVEQIDLNRVLRERLKELDCLYAISRIVETPGISLDGILDGVYEGHFPRRLGAQQDGGSPAQGLGRSAPHRQP